MIRHTVMFRWADDVADEHVDTVCAALAALPGQIPEIAAYTFGPDARIGVGNYDFVVVADFADADAYTTYRDHPIHQDFIRDHIAGKVVERAAVQFQMT